MNRIGLFLSVFLLHLTFVLPAQIPDRYRYTEALPYGGYKGMKELIRKELVYPNDALANNVEGEVIIRFKISELGVVFNEKVVQSVSEEIDLEALRVFRNILWTPASKNEKKMETEKTVKISFQHGKYKKWVKKRGYDALPYPDTLINRTHKVVESKDALPPPRAIFVRKTQSIQGFIAQQIQYPEEAFRRNIKGNVKLQFVVEPHGNITNIRALHPLGGGCTEEAIRILRLIEWEPGFYKGEAVRVLMELDVTFTLH